MRDALRWWLWAPACAGARCVFWYQSDADRDGKGQCFDKLSTNGVENSDTNECAHAGAVEPRRVLGMGLPSENDGAAAALDGATGR